MIFTININVTGVNHEELVNLFSTAFHGNNYMGAYYDKDELNQIPKDKREGDCYEDFLADLLLNGKSIHIIDYEAGGEAYGALPHRFDEYDPENVIYDVTLENILKGLSNEVNFQMMNEIQEGSGDMYTGWSLIQRIIFGEEIYG